MTDPQSPATALADILTASDYVDGARERLDPAVFAYFDGGSGDGVTARKNLHSFSRWCLNACVSEVLENAHTRVSLPGLSVAHPILLAPVAHLGIIDAQADLACAEAVDATDGGMVTSTLASSDLADIRRRNRSVCWFQIYLQPSRQMTRSLAKRAEDIGVEALVITVDASIQQPGHTALRAGFRLPSSMPTPNLSALESESGSEIGDEIDGSDPPITAASTVFDTHNRSAISWDEIAWQISSTSLPVYIKGTLTPEDAMRALLAGASGIIVSNHGGRTVDGVPPALDQLPNIRSAMPVDYPILFDSGIRSGQDVFKAIALGADAVLVGRLQAFALATASALGVAHMIKLLRQELELSMVATASRTLPEITPGALIDTSPIYF